MGNSQRIMKGGRFYHLEIIAALTSLLWQGDRAYRCANGIKNTERNEVSISCVYHAIFEMRKYVLGM